MVVVVITMMAQVLCTWKKIYKCKRQEARQEKNGRTLAREKMEPGKGLVL